MSGNKIAPTATHFGAYNVHTKAGKIVEVTPSSRDPRPSAIGRSLAESVDHPLRIKQPMVRRGWLESPLGENREGRGGDDFIEIEWGQAIALVTAQLQRVKRDHGNASIYAGSYGWASAGRFHHAQSQLRRFLNLFGGHTNTVNTYSFAAAEVLVPHVVGSFYETIFASTTLASIAADGELVVAFGGWPLKNSQVNAGGVGKHEVAIGQQACKDADVEFIYIGPTRNDMAESLNAEWLSLRPTTDSAMMLALCHSLLVSELYDKDFVRSHCVGFDVFEEYLLGRNDGQPKSARWASEICAIDAETITQLAQKMASKRTLVTASWSLQRAEYGEQPYWCLIALASMLGQIGLPGGGFGFGHAAAEGIGTRWDHPVRPAAFPVPENPVRTVFPVSRVADLLLNPGGECEYDGETLEFPDTRLVYWCGGNPFHHHQDLNRLLKAWQKPETIIVHEPWWTPTARHADIVLPCTTTLERNDFTSGHCDWTLQSMQQAVEPYAQSRNEYDIFKDLSEACGFSDAFTEGRDEQGWLHHLWDQTAAGAAAIGITAPSFEEFWQAGYWELPDVKLPNVLFQGFRQDPVAHPLGTPSGKIELFSAKIESFNYSSCPPHPSWIEPREWLGAKLASEYPLHLISNQPADKLHSQLDFGVNSREAKRDARTVMQIHPSDARERGITSGQLVRLFNGRGACLAVADLDESVMPKVLILPTGSWFNPAEPGQCGGLELHGNPNVLTQDVGTSELAQGPSAQSCLVEVEVYQGEAPAVSIHHPPSSLQLEGEQCQAFLDEKMSQPQR